MDDPAVEWPKTETSAAPEPNRGDPERAGVLVGARLRLARTNLVRKAKAMLFMLIERFDGDDMRPVYAHLARAGRGMPEGLRYLGSWVEVGRP